MILYMVQSLKGIWRVRKGVCLNKYVYKPYHPWRHGYRREKIHAMIIWWLRIVLAAEVAILSGRYIETHTEEWISTREITSSMKNERSIYGIGFEPENGELFWFHRQTEIVKEE